MTMLADVVDAVIGGDTHRDTHTLEMTSPTGATISVCTVANTDAGFAEALTWIDDHAPGRRLIVGLEGTRSYGIGLALSLIHISEPTRQAEISYAVFCLKK